MPTPAVGTVLLLDANGLWNGQYVGRWAVNIPSFSTVPGDGLINEFDFEVPIPGVATSDYTAGFYIGNDSDGDASRFTGGVIVDQTAPPAWQTYHGTGQAVPGSWAVTNINANSWDGSWTAYDLGFAITVDPASDPNWYQPAPPAPTFTAMSPLSGSPGDLVTVIGTNLSSVVRLHLQPNVTDLTARWTTAFTIVDDSTITFNIPTDLSSHPFWDWILDFADAGGYGLVTIGGAAFDFNIGGGAPAFSTISPTSGYPPQTVDVTGTNLSTVTELRLQLDGGGGIYDTLVDFEIVDATHLRAQVPAGAHVGPSHVYYLWTGYGSPLWTGLTFTTLAVSASPSTPNYLGTEDGIATTPTPTRTVSVPPSVADGDLLVMLILQRDGDASSITLPSGWTEDHRVSIGGTSSTVLAHRVAASEPASYTVGLSSVAPAEFVVMGTISDYAAVQAVEFATGVGSTGTVGPVASGERDLLVAMYGTVTSAAGASVDGLTGYRFSGGASSSGPAAGVAYAVELKTAGVSTEVAHAFGITGTDPAWAAAIWALVGQPVGGWAVGSVRMGVGV